MQFRLSTLLPIAALAAVVGVAAAPAELIARGGGGECNTGPIQCCNSVTNAEDSNVQGLLALLGLNSLTNGLGLVGVQCSSILGDTGCTQQPVCCNNNNFNGIVAIGCSPITLNIL